MSNAPLVSLTYTSRAKLDLTAQELVEIQHSARNSNALDGITGLLVFNGVTFLQAVEGAEDAIDSLLERLRADPRHSSLEIRDRRRVHERQFPGWALELVRVATDWREALDSLDKVVPGTVTPVVRALILRMGAEGQSITLLD